MNYIKIEEYSIANGTGVRTVLWVSGCSCHCKNCHNPETWNFNSGFEFTEKELNKLIECTNKPWISGLTLSGGHPLEPQNAELVLKIIQEVRQYCPNKNIWLYTGYVLTMNEFHSDGTIGKILSLCDVVVDGPFVDELKDIRLKWCGSSNQRIIDVKQTLKKNYITLLEE